MSLTKVEKFSRHSWMLASSTKPLKIAKNEPSINNIGKNRNTDSVFLYEYNLTLGNCLLIILVKLKII